MRQLRDLALLALVGLIIVVSSVAPGAGSGDWLSATQVDTSSTQAPTDCITRVRAGNCR